MKSTETKRGTKPDNRRTIRRISLGVFALAGVVASYSLAVAQAPSRTQAKNSAESARSDELKSIKKLTAAIARLEAAVAKAEAERKKPDEKKDATKAAQVGEAEEEKDRAERLKGLLYQLKLRAYPFDRVDESAHKRAVEHMKKMPGANWLKGSANRGNPGGSGGAVILAGGDVVNSGAKWEFIGPTGLGDNGRVNGVVYDPKIPNRAYVTGAQGGLWQTSDGGTTWKCLTNADNYKFPQYATACAVHPNNSNILYIGMGDYNGYSGGGSATGLTRSIDGGLTWHQWPADPVQRAKISQQCVSAIRIDPNNPNLMLVTTGRGAIAGGIYRSTDGGATFTEVTPTGRRGDWSGVEYSIPGPTGRVYYSVAVGQGVFYSTDLGVTWNNTNAPLAFNTVNNPAGLLGLRVAASKVTFGKIFVIDASGTSVDGRVFSATHTGGSTPTFTWVDMTGNYPLEGPESSTFDQAWYDLHITTVPTTLNGAPKDLLYSGAVFLAASADASPNWTQVGGLHVDHQAMAANPFRQSYALAGNDGGVYGITFNPVGRTFTPQSFNQTLGITQFYKADWDRTNANLIIGGTQDNGTFQRNGGAWRFVGGGDGAGCAIHLTNSNIQFASSQEGNLFGTTNNWAGGFVIAQPPWWGNTNIVAQTSEPPFIGTNEVSPAPGAAGNFMYYGTQYLWRWSIAAQNWLRNTATPPLIKPMGNQSLTADGFVTAIAIAPSDLLDRGGNVVTVQIGQIRRAVTAGNVVFAGTSDGRLWYTQNALDTDVDADHTITWTEIDTPTLPDRAITSINIDPKNPADILVGVGGTGSGHVFRSTNALSPDVRFTDRSGFNNPSLPDIHLNEVCRDPADPSNTWFAATDIGVFATNDAGATWGDATLPLGLPLVQCNAIEALDRAPAGTGFLNIATFGRGMWRIPLPAADPPRFTGSPRYFRFGPFIAMQLTVVNIGGTANNVTVSGASIQPDRGTEFVIPPNELPDRVAPLDLDTVGTNQTRVITVVYDNVAPRGAAVTYKVQFQYDGGTIEVKGRGRLP